MHLSVLMGSVDHGKVVVRHTLHVVVHGVRPSTGEVALLLVATQLSNGRLGLLHVPLGGAAGVLPMLLAFGGVGVALVG